MAALTDKEKAYKKEYYQQNKEEIKTKVKRYRNNHKEETKLRSKKYNESNREKKKIYNQQYHKENKERIMEKHKEWCDNNKDYLKIKQKQYREEHKDELSINHKKYSEEHKEELKIYQKQYREAHKEEAKEYHKDYSKQWYIDNMDREKKKHKDYRELHKEEHKTKRFAIRLEVLKYYSDNTLRCKNCNEEHLEFLEIDHINGGGKKHKRDMNFGSVYDWLYRHNFPDKNIYQVLCSNCNTKKVKIASKAKGEFGTSQQRSTYNYRYNLKLDIYSHYMTDGKLKCSCPNCNVDDVDVLCLDHINGDGKEHRQITGLGDTMYRWIRENNYPDTLRLLCHNCNQSLGNYGYCPHDKK